MFLPLITVYIFLAVALGGTGLPAGARVGAALKELLIAVALIVVLRLKPPGVLPERIPPAPRTA